MSVAAVVMAAGESRRMGAPKALCVLDGKTFVQHIVDSGRTAGISTLLFVLGPPHGAAIRAALPPLAVPTWNSDPSRGMVTSVHTGIAALPPRTTVALVWPVDVPLVRADTLRALLDAAPGRLVIPTYKGQGGHPVRIPRRYFGEVLALSTDEGLRALFERHRANVIRLPVDDRAVVRDFDEPTDLAVPRD